MKLLKGIIFSNSDKSRHWQGAMQLVIFIAILYSAISSGGYWLAILNPIMFVLLHCILAIYFCKKLKAINVNYSLFNALWSQWGGYSIEPKIDYSVYQAYNIDYDPIDMQYERMTEWTEKHISGWWVKKYSNYVFLRKRDAIAFKLVWG